MGNKEPPRPARVNKLTTNPFENMNSTPEQSFEKVVTVKKLQRNPFMDQLEKKSQQEPKKPVVKTAPMKKISTETCIKFESKKEKKTSETENQENEDQQSERRQLVRVSRSIEGPAPQSKSAKEKKSGSTMSLQKIFIDGPKEFFKSSKEKLYKMSKETLCEVNEPTDKGDPQCVEKKPSRSEMQNYL